ncbi:zinc-dependent metalloprotease [Thalassotalea profundi]|uniref:Periplasmic metalloprotease n=1 Tax=Thalassotalea profundi TaxID=2036687 RepID=A0ABQ3J0Z9_9GAMM|nr:zinc-dependent metalloprotease [Thalassotalea profundi]GHF00851.1 periplasmic metalloprotease [Thalassotalea profundi]
MKYIRLLSLMLFSIIFTVQASSEYVEFIKDKKIQQGYFSFYLDNNSGKVYLEIDKFNQEFLFQSSLPQGIGSNDIGLDRGQLGDTRLVRFEKVGDKVLLRQLNTDYRADTDNALEKKSVTEAFASSIIWGFSIESQSKKENKQKVIIDYTPFLLSDIHNVADSLKRRKQGNYSIDQSRSFIYTPRSKAFPNNTELESTVTFKGSDAGNFLRSVTPDAKAVTVNLHHSLIKLPDEDYKRRDFHPYSGYWSQSYADYASAIDEPIIKRFIPRHRLAKKDPKAAMSEAVEPIIYYLDAGVPEPVKSALIDGALWWDQTFEAIGYKNAFQVKILPADADPMDVRYNVIQWVHRATRGWSYGSSVIDPRSGEIIKGHVTLGSLRVRQDYLIALGLTSPFTNENTDTSKMKEMALARIRQLSAHEVGHTLGIAHNFAASVNDRASVMDYPHPLIQLVEDEIDLSNAYDDKIGVWDKYVIAYGYGDVPADQEQEYLASTVKNAQDKGLLYVSDPDARPQSGAHNTGHLWDNGKNAAQELTRMLTIREKALANFGLNSIPVNTPLSELEQVLVPIYNFHRYQVEAAAKLIAGVDYTYQVRTIEKKSTMTWVKGDVQRQAIAALLKSLSPDVLTLPDNIVKLIPPKAYGYSRNRESFNGSTGITFDPVSAAQANAKQILSLMLNGERLARLQQQAVMDNDIPSIADLFEQVINNTLKNSPQSGLALLVQQRVNNQVVEQLLALWHDTDLVSEVRSEVFVTLSDLNHWLTDRSRLKKHKTMAAQFKLLSNQINFSLNQGKLITPISKVKMPPGSPIGN